MKSGTSTRLGVEALEVRENPAVTVWVQGGVLYANGDAGDNAVGVRVYGNTISILDGQKTVHTRPVGTVSGVVLGGGLQGNDVFLVQGDESLGRLKKITLMGGGGDDRFLIDSRAAAIPPVDVAGQGGYDTLGISGALPHGGRVQSVESVLPSRLALAQAELRDHGLHPEMANVNRLLQIPANSRLATSVAGARSVDLTKDVIFQFEVESKESAGRYRPNGGATRCNVFAGDVLRAMNCRLPTQAEYRKGGSENLWVMAIDANRWLNGTLATGPLKTTGPQAGWTKVDPRTAEGMKKLLAHLAAGKPAVASTTDHIAVVRPNQPGGLTPATLGKLNIAQAGASNFTLGTLSQAWRASRLSEIQFFLHE